jgi:hypothetical protein
MANKLSIIKKVMKILMIMKMKENEESEKYVEKQQY